MSFGMQHQNSTSFEREVLSFSPNARWSKFISLCLSEGVYRSLGKNSVGGRPYYMPDRIVKWRRCVQKEKCVFFSHCLSSS